MFADAAACMCTCGVQHVNNDHLFHAEFEFSQDSEALGAHLAFAVVGEAQPIIPAIWQSVSGGVFAEEPTLRYDHGSSLICTFTPFIGHL